MSHAGHVRNFEWTLRELVTRGHVVHVGLEQERPKLDGALRALQELRGVTVDYAPTWQPRSPASAGVLLRRLVDYARYFDPAFGQADVFAERAASRVPAIARGPLRRSLRRARARRAILRLLTAAERSMPVDEAVRGFLEEHRPELVAVTPLVELGSPQVEYLRAARLLGIPTALLVASWDNLTVKGGIQEFPDLVAVWNEAQRREARELHAVPDERIAVTGAVAYDHWFDWAADENCDFLESVGLDPERPYVLYLGSSSFIAPDEGALVSEWARSVIDRSDGIQIVVRPHPTNPFGRYTREIERTGARIHPRDGVNPIRPVDRQAYLRVLAHAAAVVGVNTSGMVEAAIHGRPVLAVPAARYRSTQIDALQFQHLLPEHGGMIDVSSTLETHVKRLEEVVHGGLLREWLEQRNREFVAAFIRPKGWDVHASGVLVDELEQTVRRGRRHGTETHAAPLVGRALALAARALVQVFPPGGRVAA